MNKESVSNIIIENLHNQISLSVQVRVEPGEVFLVLPREYAIKLGFDPDEISTQDSVVNGIRRRSTTIGPIRVKLGDRHSDLNARVQGREILLRGISPAMLGQAETTARPAPARAGRKRSNAG